MSINSYDEAKAEKAKIHNVFEDAVDALAKEPPISLGQAREQLLNEIHTEEVRHEAVISVEIAKYESFMRIENENHEQRITELRSLVNMLTQRIEKEHKS